MDWIENKKADVGFVYSPPSIATFQLEPLLEEKLFLIAAEDNVPVELDGDGNIRSMHSSDKNYLSFCRAFRAPRVLR